MALVQEIRRRTRGISSAPKDIIGLLKSKATNARVINRTARAMSAKIGGESVVGAKNLDIHFKKIKNLLKNGDTAGAQQFVKTQKAKVTKQRAEQLRKKFSRR